MTSPISPTLENDEAAAATPPPPLRRHPGFARFFLSRTVSGLGSAVTSVVLPVLVYQLTRSPLLVSLVAAAGTLPYLAFGLVAGTVADRVDRRSLMVWTDWLNAACLASIPLAHLLGVLTAGQIVGVALVSSSLTLFFDAGTYGLVPELVGRERLTEANSAVYTSESVVRIAGTSLAGALIVLVQPVGSLLVDAVSFAASALLIRATSRARQTAEATGTAPRRPGFRESVREGLRFLWAHPVLRVMTVVGTLQSFAGGAVVGELVVYADRALGIRSSDLRIGLLYAAWSAGGIGGSRLLPVLRRRMDAERVLLVALPVGALLGLLVTTSTDWRISLPALALWGSAYLVVLVNTMTYSQEVTPAALQGRVNTTRRMLSSGLGVPLGALVASSVTARFGIHLGMSLAVVSVTVAAALVWTVHLRGRRAH